MKFSLYFIFSCFFIIVLNHGSASSPAEISIDSVKINIICQRYPLALQALDTFLAHHPENLEALYLRTSVDQAKILDYESYGIDGQRYCDLADSALLVFKNSLSSRNGIDSIHCLFYIASLLGGKGVVKAKNGNWPGALSSSLSSAKYFKRIIKLAPSYYQGYYGVGLFNYYLSRNLKWLPFFGDRRVEAIEQLWKATHAPFPFDIAAYNSLCWILIERNELSSADTIASQVLLAFPDNSLFLRIKMRVDIGKSQWETALLPARKLVDLSRMRDPVNWADLISGYQAVVCCLWNLNRKEDALHEATAALALPVPEGYRKISFVGDYLTYIADIRKKCSVAARP
jgi:hypothetical protein